MRSMNRGWSCLALGLLISAAACGGGKGSLAAPAGPEVGAASGAASGPDSPLPVDARIRVGKLDNGLTYYILPHTKPEKRAQLWLAVNAGSVLEDDDQQGLAHFVEHMAFNGTQHFEKMAIVNYLEGIGMKFGPDLNAYTSFDETVYMLQVPTDDDAIVAKGFDILRDWAGALAFEAGEVEKERGVVTEEWRLGRGASMRILDKQYPILFHGSRYGSRLPIGKPEILKGAPRDALVRFYKDWYRPDLMAVVAVGDFDPTRIEAAIKQRFAGLTGPAAPRPREEVPVPGHDETLISIETDPEMPQTVVQIYNKMPHRAERTATDYRRAVAEALYHGMMNARLDEERQKKDAPFVFAFSGTDGLSRGSDVFSRTAMVKQGQLDRTLAVLFEEVLRVERHGFTAGELDRAKKDVLRGYQQSVAERSKRDSRDFASEILRHFLEGEMMPGIEAELELVEGFLPTITLAELNGMARAWGGAPSRVILIGGPDTMKKPTREQILATMDAVEKKIIGAYSDGTVAGPLMASTPIAGKVVGEKIIAEVGVTEWTLSNGVRVVLKPTDFQNDSIQMSAFSPGGTSLVGDADYDSARFVDEIVGESGVGQLDATTLRKALAGKVASARPWLGELEEGFWGSASPRDLETMLQLVYLEATAPRRDEAAFATWKASQIELTTNRRLDPEGAFFEDMSAFLSQNHRRRQPVTPEVVARADLDKVLAIYRERFGDAGDFTFVLVGNLDLPTVRPLVEAYLGSLPSKGRKETWKDVGARLPRGKQERTVLQGSEPKSYVYLTFHGPEAWSRDAENDMQMLSEVLEIRLREVLREDMGGVYGASSHGSVSRRPRQERSFTVFFGCAPENVDKLRKAVFDEIAAIQKRGIGDDYIAKIKQARLRSHETDVKDNGYWARELGEAYRHGDDPRKIDDVKTQAAKVSSARDRAAARRYLGAQYVLGVLRPAAVK